MKKIVLVIFSVLLIALLTACGDNGTVEKKDTEEKKEQSQAENDVEDNSKFNYIQYSILQNDFDYIVTKYNELKANTEEWDVFYKDGHKGVVEYQQTLKEENATTSIEKGYSELLTLFEEMDQEIKEAEGQNDFNKEIESIQTLIDKAKEEGTIELTEEQKGQVEKVINDNAKYAEEEDLDAYMNTIVKAQRENENNITEVKNLFDNFDADYTISDFSIEEAYEDAVIIKVKQKIEFTDIAEGYEANDSLSDIAHTLLLEDGEYKLYATRNINTEIINQ